MKKTILIGLCMFLLFASFVSAIDFNLGSVSHFAFDSGATLADSWGNDSNGCSIVGSVSTTSTDCASGDCYDYSGSSGNYINCGAEVGDMLGASTSAFTISIWFNADVTDGADGILTFSPLGSSSGTIATWIQSDIMYTNIEGGTALSYNEVVANTLTHFVVRYNGSKVSRFINGSEIDNLTETGALDFTELLGIGIRYSTTYVMDGTLDEATIWNRALETEEIVALFNDGDYCNPVDNPSGCNETPPSTNAPNIISPANASLEYKVEGLSVDFNYTNSSAVSTWWINETTDFSIDADGILTNSTSMSIRVWNINVSINNTDGDVNSTIYSVTVTNTAPTTQLYLPVDNTNYSVANINMSAWVNDSNSDTLTAYFQVEGTIVDTQTSLSDSDFISYNYTSLSEGANLWTVIVYDGTVNATVANRTVNLDTTPPKIVLTAPTNHTHLSGIMSITTDITDDTTSVNTSYYNISNSTHLIVSNQALTLGGSWDSTFDTTTTSDDNCTISIFANDTMGNINITESTFYIDSTLPTITFLNPSVNTTTTNPIFLFNVSIYDKYLDMVNVTIFNLSNDIVYTNLTSSGLGVSTYNFTDIVNLSSLSGDNNYTIEVCGRDSLTDSPPKPNYHATPLSNKIEFYDGDTDTNITLTFQILNAGGTPISLEERNVSLSVVEDGKHITFGGTADFNQISQKARFTYHSNNEIKLIPKNLRPGHFITSNYGLYFEHQGLVDKNWTIESSELVGDEYVIIFSKAETGQLDFDPISGGLNTFCENKTIELDTTGPVCTILSLTPTTLSLNSTGTYEIIINCTDINGINDTTLLITRTMENEFPSDGDNHWSVRPPNNNIADYCSHFDENIVLADARVLGDMWYESLFTDNHTYSATANATPTGQNPYVTQVCGPNWCTINYSAPVEVAVFPSTLFLSRGKMELEVKKNFSIHFNQGVLIEFWDGSIAHGENNYSIITFMNLGYSGSPTKDFTFYYCNSSFNKTDGVAPQDDSDNCVYLGAFTTEIIDAKAYSSRNSEYIRAALQANNGFIGGIKTTKHSYGYARSTTTASHPYYIKYVNGTSGTNVSFANSGVSWASTDDGNSFTEFAGTPDLWNAHIQNGSQFELGIYVKDDLGNPTKNFTFNLTEIGDVNFPIRAPNIQAYQQGINTNLSYHEGEDEKLNGNYSDNMTIHINTASDPDNAGVVNHTLYLTDPDGLFNHTINNSFYSPDNSDVHVFFDTNLVSDGYYTMNITAYSDEDTTYVLSTLIDGDINFTIDNTAPTIELPANITLECGVDSLLVDLNVTDALSLVNESSWITNNTDFSINSSGHLINTTCLNVSVYILTISVNDTLENQQSVEYNITVIDSSNPTSNNPSDSSYSLNSFATIGWIITDACPEVYYVHRNGSEQNASDGYISGTNLNVWVNTTTLGTFNYTIFFNDSGGSSGSDEVMITIIANNPPTISINAPDDNVVTEDSSVTLDLNVTDDDDDNMTIYFFFDSVLINYSNSTIQNNTQYTYTHSGIAEGKHTWNVTVDDLTDNTSYERTWTRDLTSPTIILNNISDNYNTTGNQITFNWTATDNLMTNLLCNLTLDGSVNVSNIASTNATAVTQQITGIIDGVHTWSVICWDNTSNDVTSATRTFTIDNHAPRICGSLYYGASYGSGFEYTCSGSDAVLGIDTWAINDTTDNFTIDQFGEVTNASALGLGLWHLLLSANDSLGNTNTTTWIINITDTNIPMLDIDFPITVYHQNLTWINLSIRDDFPNEIEINDTRWNIHLTNSSFKAYNNLTHTQAEGNYSILITYNDTSGNVGNYILNYTIDRTVPSIFLIAPENNSNWTTSSTVTLTYNVSDLNPIANCYYDMSSVLGSGRGGSDTTITKDINQTFSNTFTNADYYWYINCTDEAGNVNQSAVFNLTVLVSAEVEAEEEESTRGSGRKVVGSIGGFKKFAVGCVTEPPFINRIIKGCKIENNSVCEDGENLLLDTDCKPIKGDLKSGKIFTYMWFLRFMLLLALFMFLRKDPNFPIAVLFILVLFAANGAFGDLSFSFKEIDEVNETTIEIKEITQETEQHKTIKDYFRDFGRILIPNHPYLGGVALILLFYVIVIFIPYKIIKRFN